MLVAMAARYFRVIVAFQEHLNNHDNVSAVFAFEVPKI